MQYPWLLPLTVFLPWAGALAVLAAGRAARLRTCLAIGFAAADAVLSICLIPFASGHTGFSLVIGGAFGELSLLPDGFGVFLAAVAAVIGGLAVVFSVDYMRGEEGQGRYYAMVLFFIGAMIGLVLSANLLMVVVFWEITALCSWALISFHNDDPKAVAGGIKALIITGLGGAGLLAGSLAIYAQDGSFDIPTFLAQAKGFPPQALAWIGFGFLAAAAAKSAQFPFQTWLPDAMEAPTPISALIHAATMVNAGVYLLARFFPAFSPVPGWSLSVVAVGVVSAFIAATMALVSFDLKRVLAWSTVSQLGFMVYAIGTGGIYQSQFHLLSHSVFKALLFLGAGAVIHSLGTRDMREMGGLSRRMPLTCAVFVIGSLALAGIPPVNGFWSKELLLESGLAHGPLWAYIIMLVTAGLTALYILRCVWMVFFAPAEDRHVHEAGPAMQVALIPLALGSLVTWLLAGPFQDLMVRTLPFHFAQGGTEQAGGTWGMAVEVVTSPSTWLALGVVALGVIVWLARGALAGFARRLMPARRAAEAGYGFEAINRGVEKAVQGAGERLRVTQSGFLNWNVAAIVMAVIAVLVALWVSTRVGG
ncbi:MAG: proton-conducting transporter membrane subunit [Spirochaetia bacterium]|jgi:NADH-quinone oxidoreductase subunit L